MITQRVMKTIIVATDFSEAALRAGRYAAAFTHQVSASRMILYHSCYVPVSTDTPLHDTQLLMRLKENSITQLNKLQSEFRPLISDNVIIENLVDDTPLPIAINTVFPGKKADLIIMGITGKSKIKEKIMGSHAVMAAKNTVIPLLLIPFEAQFKKIRKVVLAWDMEETEKTFPVTLFKDILHKLKAEIVVLNIDYRNRNFNSETLVEQSFMHQLLDPENATYFYNDHPDASNGILRFAEKQHADLVTIIQKKHSFLANLFRNKITKKLAFHSNIPLLVLPGNKA